MPFYRVDDQPAFSFSETFLARHLSSAVHPSAKGPVPVIVDVETPYKPLVAGGDAVFPRATIRPIPRFQDSAQSWAGKIWVAPDRPAREGGRWITKRSTDLGEVMDWAVVEVRKRRPKDHSSGPWGAPC